ncbi:MAG: hypothetical protein V1817_02990, partial [Candidatus Micrarchaeota archaeon]
APKSEAKEITIRMPSISIRIDDNFKAKLPFLLLMLLLFAFSLVLFEKSNFHTIDIVDVSRLQYNLSKLWSISFILFLLLFSFALALAMFYGFGQNWGLTLVVPLATLVIAGIASLFYSSGYLWAFIALALTISAAAFLASLRTQVKFSSIYSTAGTAVLVLVVLSFFVAFNQISANKDAYIDTFIASGVTASISQLQGQGGQSVPLASLVTPEMISSSVTKKQIENFVTEERVAKWFEGNPEFTKLSSSIKNATVKSVRDRLMNDLYSQIQNDLPALLANVRVGGAQSSTVQASGVKQVLGQTPAFVAFYNNFSMLTAIFIASLVACFAFFVKAIASTLCWLLAKL